MRLHKTGHPIADTVSDLIGDLPDGGYVAAYGILRHKLFDTDRPWFEIDKGFWGAKHYDGNYRLSYKGTQPRYAADGPKEPHGLDLKPWRGGGSHALICPPTTHVCQFFSIDPTHWLMNAIRQADGPYIIRNKGTESPIEWDSISKVITFNSTVGVQALLEGIPVVSDVIHSTIGNFTFLANSIDKYNRNDLFDFMQAHQFKLGEKAKIENLIKHYLRIA